MSRMRLEEVTDEYDLQQDDAYTDASGSDSESDMDDAEDAPLDETLFERVAALKDIVSPTTRARLSSAFEQGKWGVGTAGTYAGKAIWAFTATVLMFGIPFMMTMEQEAMVQEEEKAMQMQAGGNDLLAPGTQSPVFAQPQQPAQGVRPPGF